MARSSDITFRRRVLVIDDEAAIRSFMAEMIGNWGFDVTTDSSVNSSHLANLSRHDIIFVDMMMPGADGIQVLLTLARHKIKSTIVLMSGTHAEILVAAERIAQQHGLRVAGVLRKPFKSHELRRLLAATPAQGEHKELQRPAPEINVEDVVIALERREFEPHLQPIMSLSDGETVAFEALARWQGDRFNSVKPERFVRLAAQNGILPRLTQQIVQHALDQAVTLHRRGLPGRISINVGTEDLLDKNFPEKLAAAVSLRGLPAQTLIVELTESSAAANETRLLEVITRLHLKGFELAIDDFGAAHGALARLSLCPFKFLKIDKHLVRDIANNASARAVVKSSLMLAKRLRLTTVAQGIENEAQLHILKSLGCQWGQGYLFGSPMKLGDVLSWAEGVTSTAA
jgi:EAL domain-containing protein (putative c-di-GMP-specific phosphodiesterase class I)/AmiR/NasT family two-component response regulator